GTASLAAHKWHNLAAVFDGSTFHLYADGSEIASGKLDLGSVSPELMMAPSPESASSWLHFGGKIAGLSLSRSGLTSDEVKQLSHHSQDFALLEFEEGSKPWPLQTRGQAGYRAPQDPSQMPHSNAPFSRPIAKPLPAAQETLQPRGDNEWTI